MKKFGYMRLFRDDVRYLHKIYFKIAGVSPDHQLRFKYLNKAILNCMNGKKIYNILDAGCGGGDYSVFLSEKYPKSNVTSIDIDGNGIKINNKIIKKMGVKNIEFKCGDITRLDDHLKYDYICCIDVLEHIYNTKEALAKLKDTLKDDGLLYIHMPLKKERPMLFDKYLSDFHHWVEDEHTAVPLTRNDFTDLIKTAGFKILYQQSSFNHYLGELCVSLIMLFYKDNLINSIIKALLSPFMLLLINLDVAIKSKKGNAMAVLLEKRIDARSAQSLLI